MVGSFWSAAEQNFAFFQSFYVNVCFIMKELGSVLYDRSILGSVKGEKNKTKERADFYGQCLRL